MPNDCLVVFTSRSIDEMGRHGGSQSWRLAKNLARARACKYVICTWNSSGEHAERPDYRVHHEAYLIAPITSIDLVGPPEPVGRFIIRFREFAEISIPGAWPAGHRNPVMYANASDFGIDVDVLAFAAAPRPERVEAQQPTINIPAVAPLSIVAAKRALAAYYEVGTDAIEILIRG